MAIYAKPLTADKFPPPRDFSSLSVRDLLDARDAYHVHLAHLENVIATAIGRIRYRIGDRYERFAPDDPQAQSAPKLTGPRTFFNSVVKPWSKPCVLVFVRNWIEKRDFAEQPDQAVPRALYLPDGRVVPTCVISVTEIEAAAQGTPHVSFPRSFIGGGYLVSSEVQGREHFGSIGCLVTDGTMTYALTNRHVTGEPGREIFAYLRGRRERVGVSDGRQVGKLPFEEAFPGWPGTRAQANLDAGLIRVDDIDRWTSKIVNLPPLGIPIDLNTDTMTLDLIGCPVKAFGGMSGALDGTIEALFYRYRSIGGIDYIADLLIAPAGEKNTLPGDSGTIWCLERHDTENAEYRPLAMEWGGHAIIDGGCSEKSVARGFALATAVSTICRELDVDVVRDINAQLPEYWGDVGHYTIAYAACEKLTSTSLKKLMQANRDNISYPNQQIEKKAFKFDESRFIPLADVPDLRWKGKGHDRGFGEHAAHHADMDEKSKAAAHKGKTLLDVCLADPDFVNPKSWNDFYDEIGIGFTKDSRGTHDNRGTLPFRIWQIFDGMVDALERKKVDEFVVAAGVLSHYVGDACQPLHLSHLFDGDKNDMISKEHPVSGKPATEQPRAKGVHSWYETALVNHFRGELLPDISKADVGKIAKVVDGESAAKHIVTKVIPDVMKKLPPKKIINAYNGDRTAEREKLYDETAYLMSLAAKTLAELWESAWAAGHGDRNIRDLGTVDPKKLIDLYSKDEFLPSVQIDKLDDVLRVPEPA